MKKSKPKKQTQQQIKTKKRETLAEFTASMAAVLATGLFIITFSVQAFTIPSSSMENTLLIGDHVFVDRVRLAPATKALDDVIPYRAPKHGDVFVFISPAEPGLYVVKRVIGLPGDRIHLQDGAVYRNGERLHETYVVRCDQNSGNAGMCSSYDPYRDNFPNGGENHSRCEGCADWQQQLPSHIQNGELVVPPNHIFAMGDNRDVSLDSRYWGFVPFENVIGRPMFIYWSFDTPREEYESHAMGERLESLLNAGLHFFDQTRWSRMFRVVR